MYSKEVFGLTISRIDCAVRHGTVDFSTTILSSLATYAMFRAAVSTNVRSMAASFPIPLALVGVLTQTKMRSASSMALLILIEKWRFALRLRPGTVFVLQSSVGICAVSGSVNDSVESGFVDG